ncbi:Dehydrogenase [Labilithrix luteola]|uniref:Dehydrogenase n=1 Tax=Labilithrix luteola TaxID=1391654 RepID=A0A0K1Q5B5_9BACT|nr:oxidoreductase [Labilithrix luteola]AKV00595.1 Dehydrogenase [Labilithrix luteola]
MSKVWLVTGSSRGLGRNIATAALEAGHRVFATARKPEQLDDLVQKYGDRIRAYALDVTNAEAARAAVRIAVDTFGKLDVVVNNAGYGNMGSIEDVREDDFRAQFETNFFGVVNVTRAALPVLRAQRSGHIIQISSIGGRMGTPGLGAYQSAKWAVEGFSEVLNTEVMPLGIKVTIVEPGGFRTDWAGSSMSIDEVREDYRPSVGRVIERVRNGATVPVGDPAKAAKVILEIAGMDSPPFRILLGSDAVHFAGLMATKRAEEDAKWKSLSLTTDAEPPEQGKLDALVDALRGNGARANGG